MATILLQAQSQYSGFEALLKSYGVDRQLSLQIAGDSSVRRKAGAERGGLRLERTDRTHEVRVRVDDRGTEMGSKTIETIWTAQRE
jgi:hypothetical protein